MSRSVPPAARGRLAFPSIGPRCCLRWLGSLSGFTPAALCQVELVVIGITSVRAWVAGAGYFRTEEEEVTRAPEPCQEIPLEQVSGGALARMWSDLSIGALAAPGGSVRAGGSPGAWHTRCAA
jgi:hypothetical protein